MRRLLIVGIVVVLWPVGVAHAQVPTYVKRPTFVTDLSKRTDDLTKYLTRFAKKEVTLLPTDAAARLIVELVSVTRNPGSSEHVNAIATAVAGTAIRTDPNRYTAVVTICISANAHCEEIRESADTDWAATRLAADKVRVFVKDNAAALQ